MSIRSHALALSVVGVVSLVSSIATAGLISGGTRSGTVHVLGNGGYSGGGPYTFDTTGTVPASGPGNVSVSGVATSFPTVGLDSGATSTVNLGTVSDDYSLTASCNFYHIHNSASGHTDIGMTFTFSQQIIVTDPVNFSLTLVGVRPDIVSYAGNGNNSSNIGYISRTPPSISFVGPGTNDTVQAPFGNDIPTSNVANFSGILAPGTYTFSGSFFSYSDPHVLWSATQAGGPATIPTQTLSVSAHLVVTAVPEPSTVIGLLPSLALLRRRRA